jgi:hypothetical protein
VAVSIARYISPKPTAATVSILKKTSAKLSGRAFATEPGTHQNSVAKTTFTEIKRKRGR